MEENAIKQTLERLGPDLIRIKLFSGTMSSQLVVEASKFLAEFDATERSRSEASQASQTRTALSAKKAAWIAAIAAITAAIIAIISAIITYLSWIHPVRSIST
jgi:hypothetical protein